MKFELAKYNIDQVLKALSDIGGRDIMVNDMSLSGVKAITINEGKEFLDDLDNEGTDIVNLIFEFENGRAYQSFCPDVEHCEIMFETDDLWIILIEDLKKHLERERSDIEFKLEEYRLAMSK
jgi:hypothetical protein